MNLSHEQEELTSDCIITQRVLLTGGGVQSQTVCWQAFPNTYEICRGLWPPEQPAPARWDRSCSICPWVYLPRHRSLQTAAAALAAEAEQGDREALQAAPYLVRTATTF